MGIEYCGDYCGPQKGPIDMDCHDLKKEAGKWILIKRPGEKTCYCVCSCVSGDTLLTTPVAPIAIKDVVQGQTEILAAGKKLDFSKYVVGLMSKAAPGITENAIYLRYSVAGAEYKMVTTMDQIFILKSGALVTADMLAPSDLLVDVNKNPVQILEIKWGSFDGSFYVVATNMEKPDSNLTGHLILTNHVVTGDFAVNVYVDIPGSLNSAVKKVRKDRPVVGSKEWRQKYNVDMNDPSFKTTKPIEVDGHIFTPAHQKRIEIPAHASAFLPSGQAAILEEKAPKRHYNDPYYMEMCQYIEERLACLYPEVKYLFDWYSDDVNSNSWVDQGQRYVYLSGGLARIEGFDYEGLFLAMAHELGHLYGKPDGSESGVTCQGEADYYGAKIVLRRVWYGEYYVAGMELAIKQLRKMFSYLKKGAQGETELDSQGRPYPPIKCRMDTFEAAMALAQKPKCADCGPIP